MADSKDLGSSMQVEPDDFILSLAPGDMEDDRQNIIPSEEQNNLPADLENTDMTELANNPSLWLGLEGALEPTEESSMANVPVMMEEQIEIANQVSLMDDKDTDVAIEAPAPSAGMDPLETEAMEVDDQISELGPASDSTSQDETHSYSSPIISFQNNPKTQLNQQSQPEKKVVAINAQSTQKTVTVQQIARQDLSNSSQITKVVLAPQSSGSSGQPILFTIPQSSAAGVQSLFSSNANIRFVNASSAGKISTSLAGATNIQNQPLRVMSPQKTITLQQAQHLGLISPRNKGQPVVVNKLSLAGGTTTTTSLLTNKPTVKLAGGNVTLVRTVPAKTPTKIAPAPPSATPAATTSQPQMASLVIKGGAGQVTMANVVQARAHNTTLSQTASPQKFVLRPATPVSVASNQARPSSQASQPAQYIRLTTAQAVAAGIIPPTSNQGDSTPQPLTLAGNKIQLVRVVTPTSSASGNGGNNVVTVGNRIVLGSATSIKVATSGQGQQQAGKPIFATVSKPTVTIKNSAISTSSNVTGPQRIILPAGSVGTLSGNVVVLPASQSIQATSVSTPQQSQASTSSLHVNEPNNADTNNSFVNPAPLQVKTAPTKITQQPSPDPGPPVSQSKAQNLLESNGLKPRKPCNCTKSQCLKLYCDCFANGEFCHGCNCVCCANNLEHEELRLRAIRSCLDRNPHAFKPKIGVGWGPEPRRHNKGCHCKRSGCLKNYCECYEAKIACSAICKCIGCKNCTDPIGSPITPQEKKGLKVPAATTPVNNHPVPIETRPAHLVPQIKQEDRTDSKSSAAPPMTASSRPPFSFITQEVVEATCQCLLAQAEEAERLSKSTVETEGLVLEEFGRCLLQIIEYASKAKVSASP